MNSNDGQSVVVNFPENSSRYGWHETTGSKLEVFARPNKRPSPERVTDSDVTGSVLSDNESDTVKENSAGQAPLELLPDEIGLILFELLSLADRAALGQCSQTLNLMYRQSAAIHSGILDAR